MEKAKGRPSKEERYATENIQQTARQICADALFALRKEVKQLDARAKLDIVKALLPIVMAEDNQTEDDAVLELLTQKVLAIHLRIEKGQGKAINDAPTSAPPNDKSTDTTATGNAL